MLLLNLQHRVPGVRGLRGRLDADSISRLLEMKPLFTHPRSNISDVGSKIERCGIRRSRPFEHVKIHGVALHVDAYLFRRGQDPHFSNRQFDNSVERVTPLGRDGDLQPAVGLLPLDFRAIEQTRRTERLLHGG